MNIIISGAKHFGKTTTAEKLVEKLKKNKILIGGILCVGESIKDVFTGEKHRFLYKEPISDSQKIGPHYIKNKVIKFAERAIEKSVEADTTGRAKYPDWDKKIDEFKAFNDNQAQEIIARTLLLNKSEDIIYKLLENPKKLDNLKKVHPNFLGEELQKLLNENEKVDKKENSNQGNSVNLNAKEPVNEPKAKNKSATMSWEEKMEKARNTVNRRY